MEKVAREFKSEYYDRQPFRRVGARAALGMALAVIFVTYVFASIIYMPGYDDLEGSRSRLDRVGVGIGIMMAQMTPAGHGVTLLIALILLLLMLWWLALLRDRRIILGFSFNRADRRLTIRVRRPASAKPMDLTYPYSAIRWKFEYLSDSLSGETYESITLTSKGRALGHYFRGHPMWSSVDTAELEREIWAIGRPN